MNGARLFVHEGFPWCVCLSYEEREKILFGEDDLSCPRNVACELSLLKDGKMCLYMREKSLNLI